MKSISTLVILNLILFCTFSCKESVSESQALSEQNTEENSINYIRDIEPYTTDSLVNVVVEIPAGTNEKWEVEKKQGRLRHQIKDGRPRIIQYLPYPGNYGMIPRSILPQEKGGDGDPLDIIILGPAEKRGSIVPAKIIGVLRLLDRGEVDDKLIALSKNSPLFNVNNMKELDLQYPAVKENIESWFTHYKGPDMVVSDGYKTRTEAISILTNALDEYTKLNM